MMGLMIGMLVSGFLTTVFPWDSPSLPWYRCSQTRAKGIHSVILPILWAMQSQQFFAASMWIFVVAFPWFKLWPGNFSHSYGKGYINRVRFGSFLVYAKCWLLLCDGNQLLCLCAPLYLVCSSGACASLSHCSCLLVVLLLVTILWFQARSMSLAELQCQTSSVSSPLSG